MNQGYLTRWDALRFYILIGVFCGALTLSYIAVQGNLIPTSAGDSQMGHSTFYLEVSANGETIYTDAENVSDALWTIISQEVYPSPDAAFDAVLEPLPGNPAQAHAVLLCTTRDGVISNNTGGSWHSTYHRYDENGRRYTKTYHVLNAYPSPVVTDTFFASIDKRYC